MAPAFMSYAILSKNIINVNTHRCRGCKPAVNIAEIRSVGESITASAKIFTISNAISHSAAHNQQRHVFQSVSVSSDGRFYVNDVKKAAGYITYNAVAFDRLFAL